jgi:hypothetical protein
MWRQCGGLNSWGEIAQISKFKGIFVKFSTYNANCREALFRWLRSQSREGDSFPGDSEKTARRAWLRRCREL